MEQFLRRERLGQIINRARLDDFDGEFGRGVGRDHEHRQVGPLAADLAEEIVAAHAAEPRIGDDHEKILLPQQLQRGLRGLDRPNGIVFVAQQGLQRQTHVLLVVHDEHGWEGKTHRGGLGSKVKSRGSRAGSAFRPSTLDSRLSTKSFAILTETFNFASPV